MACIERDITSFVTGVIMFGVPWDSKGDLDASARYRQRMVTLLKIGSLLFVVILLLYWVYPSLLLFVHPRISRSLMLQTVVGQESGVARSFSCRGACLKGALLSPVMVLVKATDLKAQLKLLLFCNPSGMSILVRLPLPLHYIF